MASCKQYRESVFLEALGELSGTQRERLLEHLRDCRSCSRELKDIENLLKGVGKAYQAPKHIPEDAEIRINLALSRWLAKEIHGHRRMNSWRSMLQTVSLRPILVTGAILLMIALGLAYFHPWTGTSRGPSLNVTKDEEKIIVRNLELLKNLELLQQMDEVETLVRVLDKAPVEGDSPHAEGPSGARLRFIGGTVV